MTTFLARAKVNRFFPTDLVFQMSLWCHAAVCPLLILTRRVRLDQACFPCSAHGAKTANLNQSQSNTEHNLHSIYSILHSFDGHASSVWVTVVTLKWWSTLPLTLEFSIPLVFHSILEFQKNLEWSHISRFPILQLWLQFSRCFYSVGLCF